MGHEHDGAVKTCVHVLYDTIHLPFGRGIQRRERLIEKQDVGFEDERPRQGRTLCLATADDAGVAVRYRLDAEVGEEAVDAPLDFHRIRLTYLQAVPDVLAHGHVGEEGVVLVKDAQVALLDGETVGPLAVEQDLSALPRARAGDGFHEHGLARSGRPEDGEDLVRMHVEGRDVQDERSTSHAQVADFDATGQRTPPRTARRRCRASCRVSFRRAVPFSRAAIRRARSYQRVMPRPAGSASLPEPRVLPRQSA